MIESRVYSNGDAGNNVVYFDDPCTAAPARATITVVSKPSTIALLFAGLALFGFLRRK